MNDFFIPELILVDSDGTALDNEGVHFRSIGQVSLQNGGGEISEDDWWNFCSGTGHKFIWEKLKARGPSFQMTEEAFTAECAKSYISEQFNLKARNGMPKALKAYADQGKPVVVLSGSPTDLVKQSWRKTGLSDYACEYYGADRLRALGLKPKPAPDGHLHVIKEYEVEPENCLLFEDAPAGCQAGRAAGVYIAQFTCHSGFERPRIYKSPHAHAHINGDPRVLEMFVEQSLTQGLCRPH